MYYGKDSRAPERSRCRGLGRYKEIPREWKGHGGGGRKKRIGLIHVRDFCRG